MTTKYAGLAGDAYGAADDPRPPLVLLHGLTFDRRIWAPAIAALKALDPSRRIVAFDLPGHGESEALDAYRLPIVAERLHAAVEASGSSRPVFVGHSISGVIATIYAASYPVSGVVNVDQTLAVRPFAELVRSLAPQLKGSEFQQVWTRFRESWHAEKLPPAGERLVDETSNPRQNVVLGYWEDLFEQSPEALESWASDVVGRLRAANVPYLFVMGSQPDGDLTLPLPLAHVEVLPDSGHFPHVAHPGRLADLLVETERWTLRRRLVEVD